MIASIIVGALIGAIAARIMNHKKLGCLMNVLVGLIGSAIGQALFGSWGPHLADMAVVPAVIGAMLLLLIIPGKKR
ncbi:GlsB/YeaQ/YmgE family stress response membrane protein [Murdochiella massiliensis]|uniref:GlsB/YeaQ/YmgE family stress response membrane protein n=1 Tax=Murdochiella massiliensis TaxID=1673723 RepID=UPI000835DD99|nr:GlsB/YeaQ/YmgE family stress response membrane protein [Murdochiella massiliensis]MBY0584951.1 GlsB/YeaQ/YmgE family stress response membrane protein [Murdochiella sp. Marseille-P8839]